MTHRVSFREVKAPDAFQMCMGTSTGWNEWWMGSDRSSEVGGRRLPFQWWCFLRVSTDLHARLNFSYFRLAGKPGAEEPRGRARAMLHMQRKGARTDGTSYLGASHAREVLVSLTRSRGDLCYFHHPLLRPVWAYWTSVRWEEAEVNFTERMPEKRGAFTSVTFWLLQNAKLLRTILHNCAVFWMIVGRANVSLET